MQPNATNKIKIGITMSYGKDKMDLYVNGIGQNAIFFYELLTRIGKYEVHFIVDGNDYRYLTEMKYNQVHTDSVLKEGFGIVFTFCFRLALDKYMKLRQAGAKNVFYNCGNMYILESETCVYPCKENARSPMYQKFNVFDACWNIPQMTNTNHHYLKTLLRCDVTQVPFIWSPQLVDQPENAYKKRSDVKSLAIFEPNLSIMKWSFPPLLVCENAYRGFDRANKHKIKNVYIMNVNDKKTFHKDNLIQLTDCLDLRTDGKITMETRHRTMYIMTQYADIAVSHTWENYLNYVYFDLAWMGWPVVHNGKLCKEVGYYYDEFDYEAGGAMLKDVILHHDAHADAYLARNRAYLQQFLPTNAELQTKYDGLIAGLMQQRQQRQQQQQMKYQFIVISACENRKKKMAARFQQLGVPDECIHYLDASTPQNSEAYFEGSATMNEHMKKINCCAKSHYRALEHATREDAPEYSIIVEDDATFHQQNFIKVVDEIILNWWVHFNACDYISLGWVPCNHYNNYKNMQGLKIESISSIDPELCFLSASYFVGLQCYLVRNNETVANVSRRLNAKKHADYKVELERMMGEKNAIWAKLGAVDHIIPRALKWMVLHPMVVLEEEGAVSLLDHNNDKNHWNAYFKGEEERRKEYV
jgi:hypothetical protein